MKFKDWFANFSENALTNCAFKCIGYCEKWYFYADEVHGVPAKKLIDDIKNSWGPANYEIVRIEDIENRNDGSPIMFILFCNDTKKSGLTNEQIEEIERKEMEKWGKSFSKKFLKFTKINQ